MPKVPMNFQNNIIYKIQHKTIDELIYIGSTTNFTKRKYKHKSDCNNEKGKAYEQKKYIMIRENGGWDMFDMVLVKKYPCDDYLEAYSEEERIRREMNASMNTNHCFRSQEECKEYIKKYSESHKEEKKVSDKKYRETNKEEISVKKKEYRETHKEEIKVNDKKYRESHKEEISVKKKEKVECECGSIVASACLSGHKKTPKHLKLVNNKN